eukprot:TRINITY_DN18504_c0_g1::TRINITY_DN18504_c0_g1_i1::g.2858::m.2858 TRINITY_DN18504_c0_g1::TRINITY_DN18504_c0_g1_i1::g.2858  ORF type:complete len:523 (-),score=137.48,sp/Q9LSZ9/LCB2A_ARATH/57.26/0.0,Aminotran_1_2/PF00155.16/2.6e-55,Beta_elim_lyase/PF01212.16/2.4e-07,DegT_DnrJ_EryC1/PF01041.12/0.00037,Aminotran_5/PF00266.14/0.039,OKR_DC_1/PF01276.15/0.44,Cys_Met_Meta_PP/PF01053.15/0.29 TRINITY_DN18504_c0_g1_i1:433-1905(-)
MAQDFLQEVSWLTAILAYYSYASMTVLGVVRDFFGRIFKPHKYSGKKDYAPLLVDYDDFFKRRMFHRVHDCWNRSIASAPGAWVDVYDREFGPNKELNFTGKIHHCLNLGSYNYLGFSETGGKVDDSVLKSVDESGVATAAPPHAGGNTSLVDELETLVARFVGKEAAIAIGMGFATNSTLIPAIVGKGDLIISDELNHASLVTGSRASGARIKVFKHNDPDHLEKTLRECIAEGQPRTHRPWNKIIIFVEGIYSMEGSICRLPEIVALKKKYKAYIYMDEAHSIGCMGSHGRGVCEYWGVNPEDVDILMGTFTKSFGSVGGYIAGSKQLIQYLKAQAPGSIYAESMSPPCAQQIIYAMKALLGEDGTDQGRKKVAQLRENTHYFRAKLRAMGVLVLGDDDSPVIPMLLFTPSKVAAFSRGCLERKVAVVVVGFPATPLLLARARFCMSAAHTRADLDFAIKVIEEMADLLLLRYKKKHDTWLEWLQYFL